MSAPVEIDGSSGEGGGQILRTALTLAVLIGRPVRIHGIRARRKNPGLAPQHLTGVLALAAICDARVAGAEIGSTEIHFTPGSSVRSGDYTFDVATVAQTGSAGSVALLLQTLLSPLAFAPGSSQLTLKGGTHVAWSPPFDYIADAFLPAVERMGLRATCQLDAWGFYPVGGGRISARIDGATTALRPLELTECGPLRQIRGRAVATNLPAHIPQRMANRARSLLDKAGLAADIIPRRERASGPGAGLFLTAEYENVSASFSALGAKGKSSESVAEEACDQLLAFHRQDAPVDLHLADQFLLPASLAEGRSIYRAQRVTRHLLTNAHIIRQFVPARIDIRGAEDQPGEVEVTGIAPLVLEGHQ